MKKMPRQLLVALFVLAVAQSAMAAPLTLDCRTGCATQLFGGALWSTISLQPSGTGVFKPFVRLQANGQETNEDGHNTDANGVNDEKGGVWTHSVLVSTLDNLTVINNHEYYEFMLDIAEPGQEKKADIGKSLLSLDALQVCTASTGNLTHLNGCPTAATYDLDAGFDRSVLLDYNLFGGGNGNSDLFVYIPKSALVGASTYFYLYSGFGYLQNYFADGSFEEWAFQHHDLPGPCENCTPAPQGDQPVPEPGSMFLLGTGLVMGARSLRRRMGRT